MRSVVEYVSAGEGDREATRLADDRDERWARMPNACANTGAIDPSGPTVTLTPPLAPSTMRFQLGGVAEWLKAPVLKTGRGLVSLAGSNPAPTVGLRLPDGRQKVRIAAGVEDARAFVGRDRRNRSGSRDRLGPVRRPS